MLSNMASSLILHKRISTTVAKAKALRQYVEPLITRSKTDSTHNRRMVFSYLQDKESVRVLFDEVSEKISARPGGYTRIIRTGNRLGDNAELCMMELVDYNELLLEEKEPKKTRTRRSRRGSKKSADSQETAAPKAESKPAKDAAPKEEEKIEASKDDAVEEKTPEDSEVEEKSEKVEKEQVKAKADSEEEQEASEETKSSNDEEKNDSKKE
jgi:large subunit ribosomal protein L17